MPLQAPIVKRNTEQARALPTGGISGGLQGGGLRLPDFDENSIRAVTNSQQNLANSVFKAASDMKDRGDQVQMLTAQRQMDDWEASNLYDSQNGAMAKRGRDAFNLPADVGTKFDTDMAAIRQSLADDGQRTMFDKMVVSRRGSVMRSLYSHERSEMDKYGESEAVATQNSGLNRAVLNFNNPEAVENSLSNAKAAAVQQGRLKGLGDEAILNMVQEVDSKGRLAVLTKMADTDPAMALQFFKENNAKLNAQDSLAASRIMQPVQRKYEATNVATQAFRDSQPRVGADAITNYVMYDLEGGDQVVADGGGIAKYGVNSAKNYDYFDFGPNADKLSVDEKKDLAAQKIAKFTPAEAQAFYKERIWNPMGIDNLPENMKLLAFDTAVNHGNSKARELIEKADGNPQALLELRAQEYQRLAKADPAQYGQHLEGWMNRLVKVKTQIEAGSGKLPTQAELYDRISTLSQDPDVISDARSLVDKQVKAIEDSRKQIEQEASRAAWQYRNNGMEVPASVEAQMNPKDANDMRNGGQPDPVLYEQLRGQVTAGMAVDLGQYRWRLGSKFDDLLELQSDPSKATNARKVDDVIKNASGILLGKASPKDESDFTKLEMFRRAVDVETEALQKQTGKPASADDVQKITDRLLLNVENDKGIFGTSQRLFEVQQGETYTVKGVPENRKFYVNGTQVDYPMVVRKITDYLSAKGRPLDKDNIAAVYKTMISTGAIKELYE